MVCYLSVKFKATKFALTNKELVKLYALYYALHLLHWIVLHLANLITHSLRFVLMPDFKAPLFFMPRLSTLITGNNIRASTIFCLMTNLVTFKTHLLSTIVAVMSVFTTKDAIWFFCRIRALFCMMTKLKTIVTLQCDIFIIPIAT